MRIADYKEALKCIREVIGSMHLGTEYSHKQYQEAFRRIGDLLWEVKI